MEVGAVSGFYYMEMTVVTEHTTATVLVPATALATEPTTTPQRRQRESWVLQCGAWPRRDRRCLLSAWLLTGPSHEPTLC